MKDTKQIGDVAVAMVLAALLRIGKNVLTPFGDRHPYDLVTEERGIFTRQVLSSPGKPSRQNTRIDVPSPGDSS